jgi:hypothetical protein
MASRERLLLGPNWHIDCRLVVELPEDSIVGIRFTIYAISCLIAFSAVLFTGYLAYLDLNVRHQIADWNQKIEEDKWEELAIKIRQHNYEGESKKVESAYAEMKNPVFVSGFFSELGRTLPDRMVVDSIAWSEGAVVVRGNLRDTSEQASMLLGDYVDKLRSDPDIGPHFASISLTGAERSTQDDQLMIFQITMRAKPKSS